LPALKKGRRHLLPAAEQSGEDVKKVQELNSVAGGGDKYFKSAYTDFVGISDIGGKC